MRSRFFVLLVFAFWVATAFSQTIHWIIFADTRDADVGEEVSNSLEVLNTQFIDRINDALGVKGYFPKQRVYTGTRFTENNCNQVVNSLSCGSDDVIVFYYLGHGGRAEVGKAEAAVYEENHPWPDLQFNDDGVNKQFVSLRSFHDRLKKKGARLTVTIGMCCNHYSSNYKKHDLSMQSRRYKIVSKKFAKKFGQKLFLKYKGDVMIASASASEFSYGGYNYGGADVDCFTAALCQTIDGYANNDLVDNVTWQSFLNDVSAKCTANAKSTQGPGEARRQTPRRAINVTAR